MSRINHSGITPPGETNRGDRITYRRVIQFKGLETVTSTVVAVKGPWILLENGDTICRVKKPEHHDQ